MSFDITSFQLVLTDLQTVPFCGAYAPAVVLCLDKTLVSSGIPCRQGSGKAQGFAFSMRLPWRLRACKVSKKFHKLCFMPWGIFIRMNMCVSCHIAFSRFLHDFNRADAALVCMSTEAENRHVGSLILCPESVECASKPVEIIGLGQKPFSPFLPF